jgi:hypothetical protein
MPAKPKKRSQAKQPSETGPRPPANWPHKKVEDVRDRFATATAAADTPAESAFREAFVLSKLRLAQTHPAKDLASRDRAVKNMAERLGSDVQTLLGAEALLSRPVPGGVGYGVFYNPPFKTAWGRGTSLAFEIVCPTPPGGNVNTWLYLTGMNRAALGVEAFISYNGQSDTHFRVFDWARAPDYWQTDIPLAGLANYLATRSAHGRSYQVLPVWNSTWRISTASYRNQALLYNRVRRGWDLVYQYDYPATDTQQKTGFTGSWAAIVETFQSLYSGTFRMGALQIQLISANNSGTWGAWKLLSAADSYVRSDNVGFQLVFLDPNYAFTVQS